MDASKGTNDKWVIYTFLNQQQSGIVFLCDEAV